MRKEKSIADLHRKEIGGKKTEGASRKETMVGKVQGQRAWWLR